jgi:hypothetical protein
MALAAGSADAQSGLTKSVYDRLDAALSPPLQQAVTDGSPGAQETLDAARDGWKKLAFAISAGVVEHIVANLEVFGVQTSGNVSAAVSGQLAVQNGLVLAQSNNGTGRVR